MDIRKDILDEYREFIHDNKSVVFLAMLVLTGFIIRFWFSGTISLWNDEAITANAALSFIQNGVPDFLSGFEYWRSFPTTLIVGVSAYVFGASDLALRLPIVIVGCISIVLTFIVGKKFYGEKVGFIASVLLTFSGFAVAWSTQVRMYMLLQFLYLFTVFFIYKAVNSDKKAYVFYLSFLIILTNYTHITGFILPFVLFAYLFYVKRSSILDNYIILFLVSSFSLLYFQFVDSTSLLWIIGSLDSNYDNIVAVYRGVVKPVMPAMVLGLGGFILGFKVNRDATILTGLAVFPPLYIYILHYGDVSIRHLYFSLPFLLIWAGILIENLSTLLSRNLGNHGIDLDPKYIAGLLIVLILSSGNGFDFGTEDNRFRPNIDEKQTYTYLEDRIENSDVLITQWTPAATYYLRPPNYSLYSDKENEVSEYKRDEYDYRNKEIYSGAYFIDNSEQLQQAIDENSRGWIVLRKSSYGIKTRDAKKTLSRLQKVRESENFLVWHWDR